MGPNGHPYSPYGPPGPMPGFPPPGAGQLPPSMGGPFSSLGYMAASIRKPFDGAGTTLMPTKMPGSLLPHGPLDSPSLPQLIPRTRESLHPPPHPLLSPTRDAADHRALKVLLKDEDIAGMARSRAALRTLWDVAQVPDFRKTLFEQHTAMLGQIYRHLVRGVGRVPEDFVEQHVSRLDNLQGDIDTLVNRIASVRTWTFISHRASWVTNAKYWQEKARKIDDKLSDALHERLTQRFVDRRATIMARVLMDGAELNAEIDAKEGTVKVEGEHVGHIKGLVFSPDPSIMDASARPVFTAARRVMVKEVENRVQQLLADNDGAFRLTEAGQLLWREPQVGHVVQLRPPHAVGGATRQNLHDRHELWMTLWRAAGDGVVHVEIERDDRARVQCGSHVPGHNRCSSPGSAMPCQRR